MKIGSTTINARVALAPMAGVTDLAFRTACLAITPVYTTTEMISAKALCYHDKKTLSLLQLGTNETESAIQIFGSDPGCMAEAACIATSLIPSCAVIDINMGCPTPKIVAVGDGCALMKNPKLACDIVKKMTDAIKIPITVKMRLGWDKGSINAVAFASGVEDAGAKAICIHGRTRTQMYSGRADWDTIAKVKASVHIPIIANGDIDSVHAAIACLRITGADMPMVGRAALGNPWLIRQITETLEGDRVTPLPHLKERLCTARNQFQTAAQNKGERVACLEARKHLAWYLHGLPRATYWRTKVMSISTLRDIDTIIESIVEYFDDIQTTHEEAY